MFPATETAWELSLTPRCMVKQRFFPNAALWSGLIPVIISDNMRWHLIQAIATFHLLRRGLQTPSQLRDIVSHTENPVRFESG